LRERLENLNRLNSENLRRDLHWSFLSSRTYAKYDLAALVSVPDIDKTMTDTLGSVDKSKYSRELAAITSDYATENFPYPDGSMIDDEAGHQLAKPSSVFQLKSLH
jgi:hypothetical protein